MDKYYSLYTDEHEDLKIKLLKEGNVNYKTALIICNSNVGSDRVIRFNQHYYFSDDRKQLKEFALALKEQWIKDLKIQLINIENIKV